MKRITALIISVLLCFAFSVTVLADDIYIVDDKEEAFVPDVQVTTSAPETTTASSGDSLFGDMGSFDDLFGGLKDVIGGGVDSILGGLENGFGDFDFNFGTEQTTAGNTQLPAINQQERPTQSSQAQELLGSITETTTRTEENTTQATQEPELASVLIVNNGKDSEDGLSGSTLTLLVFIAAIVLVILVAAVILVLMTRRTEYNSAVMDKSTIPSVEKPKALSQLMNDNIADDGKDYGNITYWNEK